MKSSMVIKIVISLVCIVGIIALFTVGEKILPSDDSEYSAGQGNDEYADAFTFDPEELSYDGTGELDLLEGVTLEGYSAQELKSIVFTRIKKGESLSEKVIEYTVETEKGKMRSTRPLKLNNYNGPKVHIPDDLPEVTRKDIEHFGDLLATKSDYAVDDGFGKDVRDHAEIDYEEDAKESDKVHYAVSFGNMFGDNDVAKVDVSLSGVPAYIALTESEVTINEGDDFNPEDYVARAELADGKEAFEIILYSGDVNTGKEGTYEVEYDLEGETLKLIVNVV